MSGAMLKSDTTRAVSSRSFSSAGGTGFRFWSFPMSTLRMSGHRRGCSRGANRNLNGCWAAIVVRPGYEEPGWASLHRRWFK